MKLFADSACDLPVEYYQANNIKLIPLRVELDGREYEDLVTIHPQKIYEAIRNGKMPKTSQASPLFMEEIFTELAESGEAGVYPAFSSALSGTYQTAVMVRNQVKEKYPELDLTIIDTKAASLGYGLIVLRAAEQLQAGASKKELIQDIEFHCEHMEQIFTVEDLDFLAKGGRVSSGAAFIGGLLNIKPLLHVEEGKLIPLEKTRGRKKAIKRMLDLMEERGKNLDTQRIAISHGDDSETAHQVKEMMAERFHSSKFEIHLISSAIASHSGPGTLAIFFLNETPST